MKQIFKLSIFLLALTCCVSSFDANAKTKRKAKSATTFSKWVEVDRDYDSGFITYLQLPVSCDDEGYCYITTKEVPMKGRLTDKRQHYVEVFHSKSFNKFTHRMAKVKVDIVNDRMTGESIV